MHPLQSPGHRFRTTALLHGNGDPQVLAATPFVEHRQNGDGEAVSCPLCGRNPVRTAFSVRLDSPSCPIVLQFRVGPLLKTPDHLAIVPGAGAKGVWVEPVPELVTGDVKLWAEIASVKPSRIPGYWYHKKGSDIAGGARPMPGEKVIYRFHGGGYVLSSAHPSDVAASIPKGILEHCDSVQRTFALEYRLSSRPPYKPAANPFPAALLDALAGYNYLVNTVGFDPADIIIEGESAGGNLAIAVTRYLTENQNTPGILLPFPPAGLLLLSPLTDLGCSHTYPSSSFVTNYTSDYIHPPDHFAAQYCILAFLGPHGLAAAEMNRYISPGSKGPHVQANFKGFPPTLIIAGGAEMLYDEIVTLKEKMVKDLGESETGGKVSFFEAKDAVHAFSIFGWQEPERTEGWKVIAKWVSQL